MGIGAVDDRPTGKGVIVAIVDSGVDGTRPQLSSAFAPGSTSLVADDQPGDGLSDVHGHGTAIAGVIAARPSPESGVVGVAPDAEIVSIRVFRGDDDTLREQGLGPEASRTAAGIRAGVDAGAKIIVVALSDDEDVPVTRAAVEYAAASGALVVASAGNAATTDNPSDEPRYPAAYPDVLAVTAVDENGLPTSDSIHGNHIDVAAPGQNVLTTATGAGDCIYAQDAPAASFATAYAAGAAALLVERFPEEGPEGWAYRLKATADRANPDAADALIGWGRVQPMLALQLRPDSTTRGPASPFVDNSSSAIAPQPTSVSAAEPGPDSTPFVAGIAAAALALLATLSVLGRLRRRR
jgi:subtilisin family serine protease